MNSALLTQFAIVGAVGALGATVYGIAALWAAAGRVNWFWRAAFLAALFVAMVPIGAYEPLAMFGALAAVVVGAIWLALLVQYWRARATKPAATGSARPYPRFGLVDVFKAVLLASAVLAVTRLAAPSMAATLGGQTDYWPWVMIGIGSGLITVASACLVLGSGRWNARAPAFLVLAAAGGSFALAGNAIQVVQLYIFEDPSPAWSLLFPAAQCALTVGALWLQHAAGWARRSEDPRSTQPARSRTRSIGLVLSRALVVGFALLAALFLGDLYWALVPPTVKPQPAPPEPNGFVVLAAVGAIIDWTAVPNQDYQAASVPSCQVFALNNAAQFALMRSALQLPSRVPIVYGDATSSLTLDEIQNMRNLCRALGAEAKAAAGEGRMSDAARSYLDIVRVARMTAHGGLLVHDLVGNAIEGVAIESLAKQIDHIDANDLAILARELETLERAREPLQAVLAREQDWGGLAYGWGGRMMRWVEQAAGYDSVEDLFFVARARIEAQSRLTMAEVAVRSFVERKGGPPDSLDRVVPKYLAAVPQDPFGDGPLCYRRQGDAYLLYSVGANGTDDGGRRVSLGQAVDLNAPQGDFFFDAPHTP